METINLPDTPRPSELPSDSRLPQGGNYEVFEIKTHARPPYYGDSYEPEVTSGKIKEDRERDVEQVRRLFQENPSEQMRLAVVRAEASRIATSDREEILALSRESGEDPKWKSILMLPEDFTVQQVFSSIEVMLEVLCGENHQFPHHFKEDRPNLIIPLLSRLRVGLTIEAQQRLGQEETSRQLAELRNNQDVFVGRHLLIRGKGEAAEGWEVVSLYEEEDGTKCAYLTRRAPITGTITQDSEGRRVTPLYEKFVSIDELKRIQLPEVGPVVVPID